jgi:CubicO group peptidase (beta-lactamase class C family)
MLAGMRRLLTELGIAIVVLVLAPAPTLAAHPLDPTVADRIRTYVRDVFAELGIPGGAVVIVDADGTRFAEGFGTADGDGRAITPQTPFRIASLSKQLTGLAVRQLIDDGRLDFDTAVSDVLPGFGAGNPDAEAITIMDLLTHSAGWSERDGVIALTDTSADEGALERSVMRLGETPGIGPSREFAYSNASYDALGAVVAAVSGVSFEAYLEEHVLAPLEMDHTHLTMTAAVEDGLSEGHYPFFGIPLAYDVPFSRATLPSASMIASAEDLGHVRSALMADGRHGSGAVLAPGAAVALRTPLVEPFPASGYGWGWWSYPLYEAGVRVLGEGDEPDRYQAPIVLEHSGSLGTFSSEMMLMPDAGLGVVVLANLNDEAAPSRFYQAHVGIASILIGVEPASLTSYDDPLRQNGKLLMLATVVLQIVGVVVATRRLSGWRHSPPPDAETGAWRVRHLVLPAVLDVAVPLVFWLLLIDSAQIYPLDYLRLLVLAPDIGLAIGLITVLGIGWGVVRTLLTIRAVHRRRSGPALA